MTRDKPADPATPAASREPARQDGLANEAAQAEQTPPPRVPHPMTRSEIMTVLPGLTDGELDALIRAAVVVPVASAAGPLFRDIDVARLQLILDLEDIYALDPEGLALVMSLIDQLNGLRGDMRAMLQAVAAEGPETRARLRRVIHETRVTITRND